eukprot:GHUV01053103.1.p1 GENE.GHUV01053103.1~~GHUV01053103.1.p1  ORF type:complete len:175 (+),score=11.38 GHUV01053103.1:78-527(+)
MTEGFSWTSLFAQKLVDKGAGGESIDVPADDALKGKHVGIYFSAHWCPPCRAFTPQLANTYTKLKKDGIDFEIVFVSMDRGQEQFDVSCTCAAAKRNLTAAGLHGQAHRCPHPAPGLISSPIVMIQTLAASDPDSGGTSLTMHHSSTWD